MSLACSAIGFFDRASVRFAGFGVAMPLPDCAGHGQIAARPHVVRVEKNGALILNDGRAVASGRHSVAQGVGSSVRARLSEALARAAALAMEGTADADRHAAQEDRYDRVRVQAFGRWLAADGTSQSWTGARLDRARSTRNARRIFAAEAEARSRRAGSGRRRTLPSATGRIVWRAMGSFPDRRGRGVELASLTDGRFLNFGADCRTDFSVTIEPDGSQGLSNIRAESGVDPLPHVGELRRRVRVIALSNPRKVEFLE